MGTRVFSDGLTGGFEQNGMSYPDFIFFMLSEEDKSSESALKYWYVVRSLCSNDRTNVECIIGSVAAIWMEMES